MNKIPYFTEEEQEVIDCLFEEYWDTPNKKIEYVRGSEWETLLEYLSDYTEDLKYEQMDAFQTDAHNKTVAQTLQNIKSVTTKIEIALANGDIK